MKTKLRLHRFAAVIVALLPSGLMFIASDQPHAKRLDAPRLSVLLGGACPNVGCGGTADCTPNNGPNGAPCGDIPTSCNNYNGTCTMVQLVNGPACSNNFNGYQNCRITTLTTMCGNILTGKMNDQDECPSCLTPTGVTCGTLQVQCTAQACQGT